MIKYLILFFLSFGVVYAPSALPSNPSKSIQYGLEDGWYVATVSYFSYSTYTRSTYTLKVRVENNRITVIDFGNGGSVHSGYNNSNYFYSGGYLSLDIDYSGNIISAKTKVTITDNSITTFDITIQ